MAVEHAHPIENATLLNTVVISLTQTSSILDAKLDYSLITNINYKNYRNVTLLIFILFSIRQNSNIFKGIDNFLYISFYV